MWQISAESVAALLPELDSHANKFTRGLCELVVGTDQYPGAGILAAQAANRMGAGYVRAFTCDAAISALRLLQPSTVCLSMDDFATLSHVSVDKKPVAVVVGSGFSREIADAMRALQVLELSDCPVLVDGGGLAVFELSQVKDVLLGRKARGLATVVTPHAGEAARLLRAVTDSDADLSLISSDPQTLAEYLSRALCVTVVLKGPETFIAADGLETGVFSDGGPALAKAGTGDVLAGCIGAFLTCGMAAADAAAVGVTLHAKAAEIAAEAVGEYCVTTEDVVRNLGAAFQAVNRLTRP